jgi:hypothetical protein
VAQGPGEMRIRVGLPRVASSERRVRWMKRDVEELTAERTRPGVEPTVETRPDANVGNITGACSRLIAIDAVGDEGRAPISDLMPQLPAEDTVLEAA